MTPSIPQLATAIRTVQRQVRWKPGSLERHVNTRKKRGHLPAVATSADYEAIIYQVIGDEANHVYLFQMNDSAYVTIVEANQIRPWLVMFDLQG